MLKQRRSQHRGMTIGVKAENLSDSPNALTARDPGLREFYLNAALAEIPRLLGSVDRNPLRPTYGCLDRQFWHYRTSSFPSEMYQEGVLPLAQVFAYQLPGNRWYGAPRVRELAIAALRFSARSAHADGSCDDYYPFERALGAAVFSLVAATEACRLLQVEDAQILTAIQQRARWIADNDESGRLANHQALAALGLHRAGTLLNRAELRQAARHRVDRVLSWQSEEGWFDEYGGADPGYQTATIECLALFAKESGATDLADPLRRAVRFAASFLHPDNSYAGEYGSRGTYHFFPHGMELLAPNQSDAARLADGFCRALEEGKQASFADDRMYAHRLASLIEAYRNWSEVCPTETSETSAAPPTWQSYPKAGLFIHRSDAAHTVISTARGGVFKHFSSASPSSITDAGVIVELADGRLAVSQWHDCERSFQYRQTEDGGHCLEVSGQLVQANFETATPAKMAIFLFGMATVGRWARHLVRRLLQRRLITSRRAVPIRHTRKFELGISGRPLVVTDQLELLSPGIRIERASFGSDHQSAYVAASGVYQEGVLCPWTDLSAYLPILNKQRQATIVRKLE